MEIICAGYPKTGTKSCTAALRTLGYSVADYPETLEFLGETWLEFMNGKTDVAAVIQKYKELGFNVNQDFPGNFMWEEIYRVRLTDKTSPLEILQIILIFSLKACPKRQKVILTVRDSDEKWWKSWCGFNEQEIRRNAMGAFNFIGIVMNKAAEVGYMGPKARSIFIENAFFK